MSTTLINEKQEKIILDLSYFDNWQDKYDYIINIGNNIPPLSQEKRINTNLVRGCQSQVWLQANFENCLLHYSSYSDTPIPKGLATIFCFIVSGCEAKTILNFQPKILTETELINYLSPVRQKGVLSMLQKIRDIAQIYV